jgi:SpoVK/Ycf46/Vps4 family AAA+-type ATPase
MVQTTLSGLPVSEAYARELVERKALTAAHIQTAARFAQLVSGIAAPAAEFESMMERQLANAAAALGQDLTAPAMDHAALAYDMSLLNVKTRFPLEQMVRALQVRPRASLCFYGPPGTGKSALAQHVASRLGRRLLVRRASDLLGKYVGETEQALAAMFREAQAQGAVLLMDEADSFLQDRRGAQRNFEVSEVNELLQGMERFSGIFICTTNLLDRLDAAALRRFSFKVEFLPLMAQQREALFVQHACGGDSTPLASPSLQRRLAAMEQLTVGDFAAVTAQAQVLGVKWTAFEYLEQLEAENRVKPEVREHRNVGFV